MACKTIVSGAGVTAIVCGVRREACTACGKHAAFACDYPITPRNPKASKTCDRRICERCRTVQEDGRDFCPPHQRLMKENTKP
jgi:hypothetical protein